MNQEGPSAAVCSIAFVEMIGYPDKPVAEQMRMRARFNQLLAAALTSVRPEDRIVLDTVAGAAIAFIEGPQDALRWAVRVRDAGAADSADALILRTGLHLGPVRLTGEPGGPPNLVGDGLSVAQRVAGFAGGGEALASRAFVDALVRCGETFGLLFRAAGVRTDAQLREHEVFVLDGDELAEGLAQPVGRPQTSLVASVLFRPPIATVLAMASILLAALAIRAALSGTREPITNANHAGVVQPSVPALPASDAAPVAAMRRGTLRVNVLPWGEVRVAGASHGAAPPERDIMLAPGVHTLEIRNPAFAPHQQQVDIRAGEETRIRHDFRQ
jgi:hypothetical protein